MSQAIFGVYLYQKNKNKKNKKLLLCKFNWASCILPGSSDKRPLLVPWPSLPKPLCEPGIGRGVPVSQQGGEGSRKGRRLRWKRHCEITRCILEFLLPKLTNFGQISWGGGAVSYFLYKRIRRIT